ncbi:MAG: hypothetical protein II691_01650 [Muribaculaceae bacterium]|nr:hypothetical protein [Muribaculaceae bacterium]MBQ3909997.1 hypothetical protein [Muribaculaceae bacterium]MBQ6648988.1 hypothetical protein [Muribaculaceae bacterium]
MNTIATTLTSSDQVFATLEVGGKVLASVCKSNFSTVDDIVRFVCSMAGRFMGLARLSIRNKTQGWSMNMALASRQQVARPAYHAATPSQYFQASLFN